MVEKRKEEAQLRFSKVYSLKLPCDYFIALIYPNSLKKTHIDLHKIPKYKQDWETFSVITATT